MLSPFLAAFGDICTGLSRCHHDTTAHAYAIPSRHVVASRDAQTWPSSWGWPGHHDKPGSQSRPKGDHDELHLLAWAHLSRAARVLAAPEISHWNPVHGRVPRSVPSFHAKRAHHRAGPPCQRRYPSVIRTGFGTCPQLPTSAGILLLSHLFVREGPEDGADVRVGSGGSAS